MFSNLGTVLFISGIVAADGAWFFGRKPGVPLWKRAWAPWRDLEPAGAYIMQAGILVALTGFIIAVVQQ